MAMFWDLQALLVKAETDYGVDAAPTGGANALLAQNIRITPMEGQDVAREHVRPYLGARPTIPTGLHGKISFDVECKGSGTAGVTPAFAPVLAACAMAGEVLFGGVDTWTPVSEDHASVTIYFNAAGINYLFRGARGTWKLALTAQGIPLLQFEMTGLFSQPEAVALPVADYGAQLTQTPQVATSVNTPTFTVGGTPLILRSLTFAAGNSVETRFLVGSDSVIIPSRSETIEVAVETVPLATYNPYALAAAQTVQEMILVHGTEAGSIVTLTVPRAQIQRPGGLDQQQGVIEHTLRYVPLGLAGDDQFTLAFS